MYWTNTCRSDYMNPIVCHVKHENVYIENSKLPVCAVHTQHQSSLDGRKQREYHSCHEVMIESVLGYKSLDATKVKLPFDRSRHCQSKFMNTYSCTTHMA